MPVYEYECASCGGRFELTQKFSDAPITVCKLCNAESIRKVLSPTAFVLKGSGWYATDYASTNERKKSAESEKPATESKPAPACPQGGCASGKCGSKGSS